MFVIVLLLYPIYRQVKRRYWLWMFFAILSMPSFASSIDDDGELYLVDVISYGYKLGEGVPIYLYNEIEYLHFESLLEFLEFPIAESEGRWSGWFVSEENKFELDVSSEHVRYPSSADSAVQSGSVLDSLDGLVVRREAMETWFNLELELDLRQQVVKIRSEASLPFQQQLEQDAKLTRGNRYLAPEVGKPVADQYQWITEPQMDVISTLDYYNNDNTVGNNAFLSVNASMDFLKHGMNYSGSLSMNRITDYEIDPNALPSSVNEFETQTSTAHHNITFFRRAESKSGDIVLGLDFYEFGDIFGNSGLITTGGSGLGVNVGRQQKNSQTALGKTNIVGTAPAGWLAELYRDGVLLELGRVDDDGQFRFPDHDLNFGQNIFLVRLEGPQGELKEQRFPVWGGGSELAKGEHNIDFLLIDHRRQVFDEVEGDQESLPATRTFDWALDYGVAKQSQVGLGFTWIERNIRLEPDPDATLDPSSEPNTLSPEYLLVEDEYLTLSGQSNVGIGTLKLDGVAQRSGGNSWKLRFLGKKWGHNLYFDHHLYKDFTSPANRGRENLAAQTEFKWDSPLKWKGMNYYSFSVLHKSFNDDRRNISVRNRIGGHWNWLDLSNEITVQLNGRTNNYQGRLRFTTRVKNSNIRGELAYTPGRSELFQRLALDWTYKINNRLSNSLKLVQSLNGNRSLSVKNLLNWRFPSADVGVQVNWSESNASIGLNVNTAFGFDRQKKRFFRSRSGLANTGKVAMQLFIDGNNNGIFDQEEEALDDVHYKNEELTSGEVGGLLLNRVPERNIVNIKTDDLIFKDGYLVPIEPRYAIYTHAGSTVKLEIPVVLTGDIEGMAYRLTDAGKETRIGKMGVQLELVSKDGRVTRIARSQYDGYYSFVEVPVGHYQLRVIGKYQDPALVWEIQLTTDEGYVEAEDFHVY